MNRNCTSRRRQCQPQPSQTRDDPHCETNNGSNNHRVTRRALRRRSGQHTISLSILAIQAAIVLLQSHPPAMAFIPPQFPSTWVLPDIPPPSLHSTLQRVVTEKRSTSAAASYYDGDDKKDGGDKESLSSSDSDNFDIDDFDDEQFAVRVKRRERKVLEQSSNGGGQSTFYDVELPITGSATGSLDESYTSSLTAAATSESSSVSDASSQLIGLQLREINERGVVSDNSLDLDTLRYQSVAQEVYRDMDMNVNGGSGSSTVESGESGADGTIDQLNLPVNFVLDPQMKGIIVSGVVRGSLAWNAGVRSGDFLLATSATLGDKTWPKSTLDGVRSAVSSRKVMSSTIKFQLKRAGFSITSADEVVNEFEISLTRPLGVNIVDKEDGFVTITGFTDQASAIVRERLQIGDRVVAVESSMGGNMWPVSNVNGAISACTSRLPGQPVKLRFERVVKPAGATADASLTQNVYTAPSSSTEQKTQSNTTSQKLLARCCDVLKRYIGVYDPKTSRQAAVPSLVADRVLETLAEQSAALNARTLSLVMNSYLLCSMPDEAIRAFEASTGISGDGSDRETTVVIPGKQAGSGVVANTAAIDLYTGTDLIRAHAQKGDYISAQRVLAAMEGSGAVVGGTASRVWPGKIDVDTRSYNSVLVAATSAVGTEEGMRAAMEIFDSMSTTATPKKDLVTYNTMIEMYARAGKRSEAFAVYNSMTNTGLKPDKITITSLIKAVVQDDDIVTARVFLRDMKILKIETDVVAYNTVIRALCDKLRWYDARELVAEMEESGIRPDEKTYGLLMNGLLKANKPTACLNLFEAASADQQTAALTENVQLYTTAITAAATMGNYERALDLVSRMTFAGVKPNLKTYTALMGACLSGGKPEFAMDVFKKIENPDGFALTQGIKGYCGINDFDSALQIIQIQGDAKRCIMSGKQVMANYDYIIRSTLEARDYATAQKVMTNLLDNGFIPSKTIFRTIVNSLGLNNKKRNATQRNKAGTANNDNEKFVYLLSVFDSLARRNLPCDATFYAAFLYEGARIGGLARKISSILCKSRLNISSMDEEFCLDGDVDEEICRVKQEMTWSDFFKNYSKYKEERDTISLPPIKPRISAREIRQVLLAEKSVTFGAKRNRSLPKNRQ